MIGVVADSGDDAIVREFFELFKTPWEFRRAAARYDVVLQTGPVVHDDGAKLVVVYGGRETAFDQREGLVVRRSPDHATLAWNGDRIPLYGNSVTFVPGAPSSDDSLPTVVRTDTGDPAIRVIRRGTTVVVRIGYDLFDEARVLLTTGQPSGHAAIPTLERHIGLLRRVMLDAGLPVVEIPPVPAGYRFIACLTHDLDHPSIRLHRFDATMLGFLYRAIVRSVVNVWRSRMPFQFLWRNWMAALTLPFVHLGLARDFWARSDRYLTIEHGLGSTFFVIPFKGRPGRTSTGAAPRTRASAYGATDIAPQLSTLHAAGSEIAVHGIDAWLDGVSGADERAQISNLTGTSTSGVRMHWLFFDDGSARRLEEAGFAYDSTFGYNDTVGCRAGTMQVYRPLSAAQLLELPLIVMDTALFYPTHLDLTPDAAKQAVWPLVEEVERHGGALTINWHDRSLAPERLWEPFYLELVERLRKRDAWFPTASGAVAWFRVRRTARFDLVQTGDDSLHIKVSSQSVDDLPGLTLRVHLPASLAGRPGQSAEDAREWTFADALDVHLTSMAASA
jgi:hypothetical protein